MAGNFPGLSNIEGSLRLVVGAVNNAVTAINNLTDATNDEVAAITAAYPSPLTSSVVWNPASIADKASLTTTVSVSGAVLGYRTTASFTLDLAGLSLSSYVSAANVVSVTLSNLTGGAVDLGSGTVKVWVWAT